MVRAGDTAALRRAAGAAPACAISSAGVACRVGSASPVGALVGQLVEPAVSRSAAAGSWRTRSWSGAPRSGRATRSSTAGQIDVRGWSPAAEPSSSPVGCAELGSCPRPGRRPTARTSWRDGGATTSTGAAAAEEARRPPRSAGRSRTARSAGPAAPAARRAAPARAARWAPRLVPATACTSSRITVSTPRSDSRAGEVSSRNSDSGVVIRMSGGRRANRRRSSAGVSPVRIADRDVGRGQAEPARRPGGCRPAAPAGCARRRRRAP